MNEKTELTKLQRRQIMLDQLQLEWNEAVEKNASLIEYLRMKLDSKITQKPTWLGLGGLQNMQDELTKAASYITGLSEGRIKETLAEISENINS